MIPPIDCQRVLDAIRQGDGAVHGGPRAARRLRHGHPAWRIDWADLDATVLDGYVGIKHCRVTKEPGRLPEAAHQEEFEHYVELEAGKWMPFHVGDHRTRTSCRSTISRRYLVNSIVSTEDSAFYSAPRLHPVASSGLRSWNDLKAGKFSLRRVVDHDADGQNVLLYREKTLRESSRSCS